MAFVVTSVTTKNNPSAPDFDVWVSTILDPNVVYAEYPDLTGQSITMLVDNEVTTLIDNADQGFISQESSASNDNSVWTLVTTWESQADYLNAMARGLSGSAPIGELTGNIISATDSATVTGINTVFTSNLSVGNIVLVGNVDGNNNLNTIGTVSSIISDTSLTLESNAAYTVNDRRYSKYEKPTVLAFVQNLYDTTYPVTVETTFANV